MPLASARSLPSLGCWQEALADELEKPYISELFSFLDDEWKGDVPIYPPKQLLFRALELLPPEQVRVVILGQDPYHGTGQAEGLSFSVPRGMPLPPSLRNIYQELFDDLNIPPAPHGHLLSWVKQGVLLLNCTLSVREGSPKSHYGRGWERLTDAVLSSLASRNSPIVYLLWGKTAQEKASRTVKATNSLLLSAPHPSPLSAYRGFFGCRHFSKANSFLRRHDLPPIDWAAG